MLSLSLLPRQSKNGLRWLCESGSGPLLPIQHVCCDVGCLGKTGLHVLVASLSHSDP
jgi:hypothetical protein